MAAFTSACLSRPQWAACTLLAAMLHGCSAPEAPPRPILAERCVPVSAALPMTLPVSTPQGGTLLVAVRQRGISLAAELIDGAASVASASPVERYGEMTLLADSRLAHSYTLRIVSRDSPEITGEVCVSSEIVAPSARARLSAERAFAAAGATTRARRWQAAFDDYLSAARGFDHIDRRRSAEARQAMAQLAYRQLRRSRDGFVLATRALMDFGPDADPGVRSALAELQATIVVDSADVEPRARRAYALQLLDLSAALARRAHFGARELARLMILRGFLEFASGDSRAASAFFMRAAAQCQALRDWECHARAQQNLAGIAEDTGDNAAALHEFAGALQSLSPDVAPRLAADIWDNLGRLQGYVGGLFSLGEQSQLQAIRLYASIDDCDGARRALSTLGDILVHVGSVADAVVYLDRALSHDCAAMLAAAAADPAGTRSVAAVPEQMHAGAAGTAGVVSAACEDLPAPATLSADSAGAVFRALLAINYAAALEADAATAQRCLSAAGAYASSPRLQLRLANASGFAYIDAADPARARASFTRALAVADQAKLAPTNQNREVSYLGLARAALLAGQPAEARRNSTRALLLGSARADVGQVIGALQVLALGLEEAGDRTDAIEILRTAANLIEQVPLDDLDAETRATFLATQHGVFEELTDAMVADATTAGDDAQSRVWAAFAVSERGRARSLQYAISQARDNDPLAARARPAPSYQQLLPRVAAVAASTTTGAEWSAAVRQLQTASIDARQLSEPVTQTQLVPQLNRLGATLVEYATGHNDMYAFVIDAGAIQVVRLGSRKRITAAAADLYERLHDPEGAAADIARTAKNLGQLVLWPLTARVTRTRVIFIADDSLHTVPFAVLPWSHDPRSSLVLQHAETALMPSALFMMHHPDVRHAADTAPRFELIGDPIFQAAAWRRECSGQAGAPPAPDRNESLPRLPGSRTEVLAIAALARAALPASRIDLHLGCRATPSAVREAASAAPDVLHIATHGYVDALRPRLSALALTRDGQTSDAGGEFGLLDILAIKTAARLVVLSACETSRGRLLPGEGVLGPAQAFLASGATAVLASYWRIDDAATASFMQTFYKYLLRERLPAAAALRRAQLEHASTYGAHDWAGFALFGWPDAAP